jgi:hypothetical protein
MHMRPKVGRNLLHWLNLFLAIVLVRPAILTLTRLVGLFVSPESSFWFSGQSTLSVKQITFWDTPVLWLLQGLGETVQLTDQGVRIGGFDPMNGRSATEFLLCTPDGWLIMFVALLVLYVFLNLMTFFLSPVFEALRLKAERRLERKTFELYGKRWLGLWSPDDEAINGLRATLDISMSFVSRMTTRTPVLVSDYISILSRPYGWLLAPLFNRGVRPLLDILVRSVVVKRAQGNNRPAASVVQVSSAPIEDNDGGQFPPLPARVNACLVDRANDAARGSVAQLRQFLAAPSFTSGLEELGENLTGKELVHTSYFDHPETIDLLAMHIAWTRGDRDWQTHGLSTDVELIAWLRQAKTCLGATMTEAANGTESECPQRIGIPAQQRERAA